MANFMKQFGLGFLVETEDQVRSLWGYIAQEGKAIIGYYGFPYLNQHFGDVQLILRAIRNDEEKQFELVGMDTHSSGSCIWEVRLSGMNITRKDADVMERRCVVKKKSDGGGMAVVNIVNADVLPSFDEDEEVKLQMIAFPAIIEYFKDEDAYVASQPESRSGKKWLLSDGTMVPTGLLHNRDPENDDFESDEDLDDLMLIRGTVKALYPGAFELGGEKRNTYLRCVIGTEYGDLEIVHTIDDVKEAQRDNIRIGATVNGVFTLSGDAAICEYEHIMTTVSGQFIICNDANNQYYIDVDKVVDYDEKIKQRASIMADGELNRYFYQLIYSCLDWDAKQYVPGFEIYQRDLNWDSHNIFREGYLFLGLPGERSTAQPERDFYIHIMPPYSTGSITVKNLEDEVYFFFKSTSEFKEILGFFSAANAQAQISEGKDKAAYLNKAAMFRKKLIKYLSENKNTCFDIQYKGQKRQVIEMLRGRYNRDMDFKDTVDLTASVCLDEYFCGKYPDCPVMKTRVTRKNMAENVRQAFEYFAGRKTQTAALMLQSFGVLDGDKIRPEGSRYAAYYIDQMKQLPPQGVINKLFDEWGERTTINIIELRVDA